MMRTYKLQAVLHSGIEGRRGTPRKEKEYSDVLGVTVFLDAQNIQVGKPIRCIVYLKDANVSEVLSREEVLSVKHISREGKRYIIAETEKAIFKFLDIEGGGMN